MASRRQPITIDSTTNKVEDQATVEQASVFDEVKDKAHTLYLTGKEKLSEAWAKVVAFFSNGINWAILAQVGAWVLAAVVLKFMLLFMGVAASMIGAFAVIGAVKLSQIIANGAVMQAVAMYQEAK